MDTADDYLATVPKDDSYTERPAPTDSSKWDTVRDVGGKPGEYLRDPKSLFTIAWILGIGLGLIWIFRNGGTVFAQWRENRLRRYVINR